MRGDRFMDGILDRVPSPRKSCPLLRHMYQAKPCPARRLGGVRPPAGHASGLPVAGVGRAVLGCDSAAHAAQARPPVRSAPRAVSGRAVGCSAGGRSAFAPGDPGQSLPWTTAVTVGRCPTPQKKTPVEPTGGTIASSVPQPTRTAPNFSAQSRHTTPRNGCLTYHSPRSMKRLHPAASHGLIRRPRQ